MQIDWSKLFSYINGFADRKTIEEVESWREKDSRNEEFYRRTRDYYANSPTRNESFSEGQLDILYKKMLKSKRGRKRRALWQRTTVAASVILLLSAGVWWYYTGNMHDESKAHVPVHAAEVIIITESGDKFTAKQLDSGIARQVADNKLEYSARENTSEEDAARVEKQVPRHTIIVPRGKTFELVLADGTFVLLGPSSELTYPVQFDSCSTREVTLRGEAYFEVTKSSNRFAVNTERMKLQVYGTTFNVFAREKMPVEAVLVEGRVGITPESGTEETILHPGDMYSIDEAGDIKVMQVDLAEYKAKRNGYVLFNGKTIEQIVRSLELYYDVDFVHEGVVPDTREYVFSVKRTSSLREVLDVIVSVADVKFVIDGKEVEITRK